MSPTRTTEAPPEEPLAMQWTVGRVLIVLVVLTIALFWIWIFAGGPAKTNPDHLDDRRFAARTEARCKALLADLDELPGAGEFEDAEQRADTLDRANRLVTTMVDEIEADAPTTGDDAVRMQGWIKDWRLYLADRERYAKALRVDPDAKLTITENPELKDGVDQTIQIFAHDANGMDSCVTPGDVG